MSNSLVTQQLNSSTVEQLKSSAYKPWAMESERKTVNDLIIVSNGHIIINPNSCQKLGTGMINIFEHGAKQAIYGAFDLCLGTYAIAGVGYYELVGNQDVAYERGASMFMNVEGHGWTAFHRMDQRFLPIDLPDTGDVTEAMRLKYAWLDLIVKGAYIDIDVATYAPQMYNYFASLLTMEPEQCKATIFAHVANKKEKRLAWAASQAEATPTPDTFRVGADDLGIEQVRNTKSLLAKKGAYAFSVGTASDAAISQLAWLLNNGYTLSRPA
jgi:hypothetical protein